MKVLTITKEAKGDVALPKQFAEPLRPELIARAVRALQSRARQPYGADPRAGLRASAELSRRRRKYRGSYGMGISRVPRKILTRNGLRMYWVGAVAPGTVGGRRAHPPKAEKQWAQKLNKRENRKAIRSALAATIDKDVVELRGHKVPDGYPFALDESLEQLAKTKELVTALERLGFGEELERAARTKVRGGKSTMRGRRIRRPKSLLLVTAKESPLRKAAANLSGVECVTVDALNAELLAPGTHPGRATLFTNGALERLEKEGLFTDAQKGGVPSKKGKTPVSKPAKSARPATKPAKASAAPAEPETKAESEAA